jgi:Ca2+-binding RTX toxin-like protein
MTITTGNGGGGLTFDTLAAVTTLGAVVIDTDDTITFTIGATGATSVGSITVTGLASDVNLGTWGAAGATTIGDVTFKGSSSTGTDLTIPGVLSVGAISTAAATAGTYTITLNDNTLIGTTMTGGAAIDIFTGTGGNDIISTGAAADTLNGGAGDDTLTDAAGASSATGGAGADTISMGADNDTILGGAGADVITTGTGTDEVEYSATGDFGDTITDFVVGTDNIDFNVTLKQIDGAANVVFQSAAAGTAFGSTTSVFELTGVTTADGTAAQLVTALGNTAVNTPLIAGDAFLIINYTAAGTAQIWYFLDADNANVAAGELTLVATLNSITADSMVTGDFI